MSKIEKIYQNLPFWIKTSLVGLYGIREKIKIHGKYYKKHYTELQKFLLKSGNELKRIQEKKNSDFLLESLKYSPYYSALFKVNGINKDVIINTDISTLLSKIPFLEKETLRKQLSQITSRNPLRPTDSVINTSGTTGTPMTIDFDKESKQLTYAQWRRYFDWIGLPKKFKSIRFSGRIVVNPSSNKPPFWVYNFINKQLFMSTYHLRDKNLDSYIKKINSFKPEYLDGYPSAFYILANFILRNKITLKFKPLAISTTAETLFDHHREAIEKAFDCKVYNQYASSEGAPWIVECRLGQPHLWTDTGVFEYIDQNENKDGTINSELVVTSFRNYKTPLIRYRIGDVVCRYKDNRKCSCGSNYPIIHKIIGRQDDILFTDEKGFVGRLDPVFKGLIGIVQSKIIQLNKENLNVLIVTDDTYSSTTGKNLLENLYDRLGQNITIKLTMVEKIDLSANGKFKSVERQFKLSEEDKI